MSDTLPFLGSKISASRETRAEVCRTIQHLLTLRVPYLDAPYILLPVKCSFAWIIILVRSCLTSVLFEE